MILFSPVVVFSVKPSLIFANFSEKCYGFVFFSARDAYVDCRGIWGNDVMGAWYSDEKEDTLNCTTMNGTSYSYRPTWVQI